jgi:hypothetical protein
MRREGQMDGRSHLPGATTQRDLHCQYRVEVGGEEDVVSAELVVYVQSPRHKAHPPAAPPDPRHQIRVTGVTGPSRLTCWQVAASRSITRADSD